MQPVLPSLSKIHNNDISQYLSDWSPNTCSCDMKLSAHASQYRPASYHGLLIIQIKAPSWIIFYLSLARQAIEGNKFFPNQAQDTKGL